MCGELSQLLADGLRSADPDEEVQFGFGLPHEWYELVFQGMNDNE
jgi:hypothetical protein